jgi:hypothetical protein
MRGSGSTVVSLGRVAEGVMIGIQDSLKVAVLIQLLNWTRQPLMG